MAQKFQANDFVLIGDISSGSLLSIKEKRGKMLLIEDTGSVDSIISSISSSVSSLPINPVTNKLYHLTLDDDSHFAPAGLYYWDENYWYYLAGEEFNLGNISGDYNLNAITGVYYIASLDGNTTLTIGNTMPNGGVCILDYETNGYTMTENNFTALYDGDLDNISAAKVRLIAENNTDGLKASTKERL